MITKHLKVLNTVVFGYANPDEGCRVMSNANMAVDLVLRVSNLNSALATCSFLHQAAHYCQHIKSFVK